jgi:hypothetical protein
MGVRDEWPTGLDRVRATRRTLELDPMAKSIRKPAQYLSADVTPDATPTVAVSAYRAPASEWERANVVPGWHVLVNTPSGPVAGMVRMVGQDNRTLSLDTASGPLQAFKHDVATVLVRPLTEWESGVLASVATDPDRARHFSMPSYDPLSVAHVVREHWFRLSGGAKTARVLKAMTTTAKAAVAAPAVATVPTVPAGWDAISADGPDAS